MFIAFIDATGISSIFFSSDSSCHRHADRLDLTWVLAVIIIVVVVGAVAAMLPTVICSAKVRFFIRKNNGKLIKTENETK